MLDFPLNKGRDCKSCESRKDNIFCDLPDAALEILNKSKVVRHYRRGQFIFHAGSSPSGLYCVSWGLIKLETEGPSGNGHILRVVQGGSVLGYRSFFASEPYEASAVVHEDSYVCLIPREAILELLKTYPDVALKLLAHVAKELRAAEGRLCAQTDKDAAERTAEALLFLKENYAEQNWTRKEIAEWAGTTPETVMRSLADFERQGLIEQKGRKITIKDREALMERANLVF